MTKNPPAYAALAAIGLGAFLVEWLPGVLGPYGYFIDEFYYLACADHLAWGYFDHPPLSIAMLALVRALGGLADRAPVLAPVLAGAVAVVTGLLARRLGAGGFGQALAGLGMACAGVPMVMFSLYSMNALDLVIWTAAFRIVAAILGGGDPRLWLAFGLVAGIGLQNKISVLFLGFGIVVGLAAARRWDQSKTPWIWLGGLVAAVIFTPNVLWQAAHDWPTLEFMAKGRRYKMEGLNALGFLGETLLNGSGSSGLPRLDRRRGLARDPPGSKDMEQK